MPRNATDDDDALPPVIGPSPPRSGLCIRGADLVVEDWTTGEDRDFVAPLHVHHADDEAWHVISGALRFRFKGERELVAVAGTTVLVPAGMPHTFGNAGPGAARYLIILPARLHELIRALHAAPANEHAAIFLAHESELVD
ncbi:MAG TPA: cupin domain-containing protein [Solirubrobacteraceae bacterium]|nr:cupin domain-containing protein [Solirubrobacteraceae bacterium]